MAIISIGMINKKLLYPLIYLITYAPLIIYWSHNETNIITIAIDSFGASIGQILSVFIKFKFRYKLKKNNKIEHNYFKDFFIQFLINIVFLISYIFGANIEKQGKETNYVNKFYINDAIVIIFITIITHFILKDKYYIHHIISLTVIAILSTTIDLILKNFFHTKIFLVISSIIYVFADSLLFSYYKYFIEFKYYYFLDPLFAEGIINIFLRFFISLIFKGFIIGLLGFLIVKELTPNFVVIAYGLARIPSSIIEIEDSNRWIILSISIIQMVFLFFYLEIIEYNFCSLNKNTKRNILLREQKQKPDSIYCDNDDNTDEVTIKGYDITEGLKNEAKTLTELNSELIEDK